MSSLMLAFSDMRFLGDRDRQNETAR